MTKPTSDTAKYVTNYYYDEAGNRICKKVYRFIGTTWAQENAQDLSNDTLWQLNDEVYSRRADGKDLALYVNGDIEQWNVFGADNLGYITNDYAERYYLKDHLGSVRVILKNDGDVVSAQDYNAWGYILEGRKYDSDTSKYKFTGKERDKENNYDYFGARYYDARIGRWGGVEPYYDDYLAITPYNYSMDNPVGLIDLDGRDVDVNSVRLADETNKTNNLEKLVSGLEEITGLRITVENDLLVYDESKVSGGSSTARKWVKDLINSENTLKVYTISSLTSFGYGFEINLNPEMINRFIEGAKGGVNPNTMGWGTSFIHEMLHTEAGLNLKDVHGWGEIGPVEHIVNKIRGEMGEDWGKRTSYDPKERGNIDYYPFSDKTKSQLDRNEKPTGFRVEY
ncbi:MAG: RHS repeat-associated core domain-containing protein [Ignavibacteria bacterium]